MSRQLDIVETSKASNVELAETMASSIYSVLKDDIITGKLKPGSKLRLQALNKKYNIGNSPLREALNRLTANGLVSQQENKGFTVSSASIDELRDIVNTRCSLEEIALRQSIENNDEAYYEKIVLLDYRISRVVKDASASCCITDAQNLNLEFHQTILSGCGSKLLMKYCLFLYEQTQRYSNLAINQLCQEDHEEIEHKAICEAILDRDADKAVELLRSHYQATKEIVIKSDNL